MQDSTYGLSAKSYRLLKRLSTPIKIQDFLDTLPINFEKGGETYMSVERTLNTNKAHCFEGALVAAAALLINGEKPLILDLKTLDDEDHVVTLYKRNGYWGAISKTNHAALRFRDPIYASVRELAASYFHEYFVNKTGKKTLRSFSRPLNLMRFGTEWLTSAEELQEIVDILDASPHTKLFPKQNEKLIRPADSMERKAGTLTEWKETDPRT